MSEREMADPQTYRGGVEEPEDAKGGPPAASCRARWSTSPRRRPPTSMR